MERSQVVVSGSAGGLVYAVLHRLYTAALDYHPIHSSGTHSVHTPVTAHQTDSSEIVIGDHPTVVIHLDLQLLGAFLIGILFLPCLESLLTLRRLASRWLRHIEFVPLGTRSVGRNS